MQQLLYNIIFPQTTDLSLLPMAERKVVDALTFWEPATDYPEQQDVLVYEHLPIVCMWLDTEEKTVLEAKGLIVEPYAEDKLTPLADPVFNAPGTLNNLGHSGYHLPLRGDLVKGEGFGNGNNLGWRLHHYTNPDTNAAPGIMENYENPDFPAGSWSSFRAVGLVIPITLVRYGFTSAWQKGYTGEGIKVGIIDSYYENGWHPDLTIAEWKHFGVGDGKYGNMAHAQQNMGVIAGPTTNPDGTPRTTGRAGALPDAAIHLCSPENFVADVEHFIAIGVDAISISWTGEFGGAMGTAIKTATDKGIAVFVAAGNIPTNAVINSLSANTGAIPVAGLRGGVWSPDSTTLNYQQVAPYANKVPAFAVDCYVLGPSIVPTDPYVVKPYSLSRGTSFATPLVAAMYCVYKQAYPNMTLRGRLELMKMHATESVEGRSEILIPTVEKVKAQ